MFSTYEELIYFEPDYRFFVDDGQSAEAKVDFLLNVIEDFGNDSEGISVFFESVSNSKDASFAFIFGSAVNSNLGVSEIEDVDFFVVTRDRKFVYDWDQPKGMDTRYLRLSELEECLKVEKRFFSRVFSKEYNVLGGIFSNGLVAIKSSKDLENILLNVRKNFPKIHIQALSQMVEYDCRKWLDKHSMGPHKKKPPGFPKKRRYSFPGNETLMTFDEAHLVIEEGIRRKNIQPKKGAQILRKIMERIWIGGRRANLDYACRWR
ncbi:MAG: hypothetical protein BBJ60_09520 [Desulfobacterales bacterium S7086C20]|nr:MAG: hypothetical protein BBJ60_09520 [Desulfobacterales bacterium S7086C20]